MDGHVTGGKAVSGKGARSLLPVFTVVFVIAWGMLTVLIVLQDRMIDAQRDLIHVLFKDNVHEAALKSVSGQNRKATENKNASKRPDAQFATERDADGQRSIAQSLPDKSAQAPLSQVPLRPRLPIRRINGASRFRSDRSHGSGNESLPMRVGK
ncbi:MAG: hypothetical protein DMG93_06185 [Acidobacteria bacterium]|nr:MAG: hypothetical protein DMG93_06185 [Acidobacteriota bacterium]